MKLKAANKKIALQRIRRVFRLAQEVIHSDEDLAQNYVTLARKISMASKVRIPEEYRRQICNGCKRFILAGFNCRVRLQQRRESHVVTTCGHCGRHMRVKMERRKTET